MRRKKKRKMYSIVSIVLLLAVLSGCGQKNKEEIIDDTEEVVIPILFREDPETGERSNANLVEAFNEEYEGKYCVEAEWMVGDETSYRRKIKELNALDQLPAIITDVGFDYYFYQMLVENDRLVNLSSYIDNSPKWKSAIQDDIYQEMVEDGGEIYMSPLGNLVYSSVGIIYNKELLRQSGYDSFPDSWEEFMQCLETLKKSGITPLALHGSGMYWVPMLFSTAYASREEKGMEFLHIRFPDTFQNETMYKMMDFFRTLYNYTWQDALEINYTSAEERFYKGEAAIIANGPWMFLSKPEEEKQKYGFVAFPGEKLIGSWQMTSWAATSSQPEEVIEGAVEFLKYRTLKDYADVSRDAEEWADREENDVMKMYLEETVSVENLIPNYQLNWEQEILEDYMTVYIPTYITDGNTEKLLAGIDDKMKEISQSR